MKWVVPWCYGNYRWLAIVLESYYRLLSFQSFVLGHLVITTSATPKKLP